MSMLGLRPEEQALARGLNATRRVHTRELTHIHLVLLTKVDLDLTIVHDALIA